MKKIKVYLIAAFALMASVQSCREEYLSEPTPTDAVSPDIVYGSVEGAKAYMAGILRNSRGQFDATDSGNLSSIYFARTVKGNDVINSGSWFSFDYSQDNREPNYRRVRFSWNFPYSIINKLNAFIKGVSESTAIADADKKPLLAQAYTYRAWMYFELSLEFQHTYSYDPSLPAPPIYTEPNSLEGKEMSTMREMYEFIISDLEKAIQDGSNNRTDKSYFNKQVTYGLAARVYQVMAGNTGDVALWTKAGDYAKLAYGGNIATALDSSVYGAGFDNMDESKEWILAMPQSSDQSSYYWVAPSVFMDIDANGYKNGFINKHFVSLFSSTDVRNLFTRLNRTDFREYYTTKFKFAFDSHVALMRTAEMVLIHAEALYHSNPTEAHNVLFALQKSRDVNAVKSSNTGATLLEEILVERRKELYAEIGVEWFDAKRLRRGLARTDNHRLDVDLSPDDKRFFLKIPQAELDANLNIPRDINNNR